MISGSLRMALASSGASCPDQYYMLIIDDEVTGTYIMKHENVMQVLFPPGSKPSSCNQL